MTKEGAVASMVVFAAVAVFSLVPASGVAVAVALIAGLPAACFAAAAVAYVLYGWANDTIRKALRL